MSLQNWGDLFKYNKELLEDDFNHGQALVIKTKTVAADKTEISTTFKQGSADEKGDSKVAFEGKFKGKTYDAAHEFAVKQDGSASYDVKYNVEKFNAPKGLQLVGTANAQTAGGSPSTDFKGGFEYTSDKVRAKLLVNARTQLADLTWSYALCSHYHFGGQFNLDPRTTNLEKYDLGFNWVLASGANLGLKHESTDKKALNWGRFLLYVNHAASATQTVGSEFALNWQTKALEAKLGVAHKFNDDTSGKFKVNQDGHLDAVLKHRINSQITAAFVTGVSLKTIVATQKHKFLPIGLSFDVKI